MIRIPRGLLGLLMAMATAVPLTASAQTLDGPLKIVVGYPPGGAADRAARLLVEPLRERLGVPVVVENKTGAGGRLSAQSVRTTPADQNVLLMGNPAINVVAPLMVDNPGYDPLKDFVPVSQVTRYDFAVAVGPAVPVREMNHLLAWLRANPEKANFAVPATGSLPHFFALMVGESAKVPAQIVGYRGSAPLLTDLIGGQVPVAIDTLDSLLPQHRAGKLRILATGSAQRSSALPDLPTLKESNLDVVADGWSILFAPASMPRAKVELIGSAIAAAMKTPDLQARFRGASMDPISSSPAETARHLAAYRAKWEPVIKASGLRN